MINSAQLLCLPKSLSAWNTSQLSYSHSQVLDFGHASGSPISAESVVPSASLSDSVVSEEASITPRLIVDLGDPSYHSNPVVPMCAKTHEFLRLIRVLIRDMVDTLDMSNDSGFVTIGDLVQMLMAWGSDANEEQVLDLLTKVGSQFLDVLQDDITILIKDKAHESVPAIATFKSTPSHVPPEAPPPCDRGSHSADKICSHPARSTMGHQYWHSGNFSQWCCGIQPTHRRIRNSRGIST